MVAVIMGMSVFAPANALTFGDIDCSTDLGGTLAVGDTVDGNLTVSSDDGCIVEGTVDGNIINQGSIFSHRLSEGASSFGISNKRG